MYMYMCVCVCIQTVLVSLPAFLLSFSIFQILNILSLVLKSMPKPCPNFTSVCCQLWGSCRDLWKNSLQDRWDYVYTLLINATLRYCWSLLNSLIDSGQMAILSMYGMVTPHKGHLALCKHCAPPPHFSFMSNRQKQVTRFQNLW